MITPWFISDAVIGSRILDRIPAKNNISIELESLFIANGKRTKFKVCLIVVLHRPFNESS